MTISLSDFSLETMPPTAGAIAAQIKINKRNIYIFAGTALALIIIGIVFVPSSASVFFILLGVVVAIFGSRYESASNEFIRRTRYISGAECRHVSSLLGNRQIMQYMEWLAMIDREVTKVELDLFLSYADAAHDEDSKSKLYGEFSK